MSDKKTRAPRFRLHGLRIVYDTGEDYWTAPVVDASESGMFVETTHDLPVGSRVTIMPDAPDDDRLPFEVVCTVVRVHELDWDAHYDRTPGLALVMNQLAPEQGEQFQAYLREHGELLPDGVASLFPKK